MSNDRKTSYKLPPTTITDKLVSQAARRNKALEEQKRRRAQKVDSARQLDLFADLHLGSSDDDADAEAPVRNAPDIVPGGLAPFASMLADAPAGDAPQPPAAKKGGKGKGKSKRKRKEGSKPNRWADKIMYAELLEMNEDFSWSMDGDGCAADGLPADLEEGWVAVAPVPVGKRCLAITHQSAGLVGIAPNTTLRSRVLGKSLMPPFPSALPPLTILDCILDPNWRDNGILHVLDVLKWKGQDVGDCETPFRFWWRDTRLAELPRSAPPSNPLKFGHAPDPDPGVPQQWPASTSTHPPRYRFPYPTTFVPVPYHTDMTLPRLSSQIIPLARSSRVIAVDVPAAPATAADGDAEMDIDSAAGAVVFGGMPTALVSESAEVASDGLLLYIARASYEPGTSPLSSWVPIVGYTENHFETEDVTATEGPLDVFERLVRRRLQVASHS